MTGRVVAEFLAPDDEPVAMAPADDDGIGRATTYEAYTVETTDERGRAIHEEVVDEAGEAYSSRAAGITVLIDAGRYAELAAWHADQGGPVGRHGDLSDCYGFGVRALDEVPEGTWHLGDDAKRAHGAVP